MIPRSLQIGLRRIVAREQLKNHQDVWPIDHRAGAKPEGWTGWPDGKQFAVVMTHDVDTARGQDRCRKLMELEMKLGFRSSFNFVPERYQVSESLREELVRNGFEVGVHGLYHDGKYYTSKEFFHERAGKINTYIKQWGAVGYRAPSMLHKLEWFHELDIEYDASTFDTDPFEPNSKGVCTIFPFWYQQQGLDKGFVELPYTLTQDFTLFIIMRKKNTDIWKRKIDWIADNGGMVLLNTHPDYMGFNGQKLGREDYPSEYYEEILNYIQERYRGTYWHVLPKDLARVIGSRKRPARTSGVVPIVPKPLTDRGKRSLNVCMLAYTFYLNDGRVKRYAETLAQRGDHVDVIALQRGGFPKNSLENGVQVYRIQKRIKNEKGKLIYLTRLMKFFVKSAVFITYRHLKKRYDVIHVHSVPDFEVMAALIPKLLGAKIILDIHDIEPEFYAAKFNKSTGSITYKALVWVEKMSAAFSDHVIIANDIWYETITKRSVALEKCSTFLNYPEAGLYRVRSRLRDDGKFIMLYPGSLNWHQGLDIAVRAFARIKDQVPQAELHIIGEGSATSLLLQLISEHNLQGRVFLSEPVPHNEIVQIMANADLGIVPKRADSFGNEAFSTKIFEFMALGVPVIVSDTKIDKHYFNESLVNFFKAGDDEDLARCMLEMAQDPAKRAAMITNASEFIKDHSWTIKRQEYLDLVDRLVKKSP